MIIYVTKDNEKLISCLKNKVNTSEIQLITGVKYLKRFVLQEMKNLNNFEHIIIDIADIDTFIIFRKSTNKRVNRR